MFLSDFKKNLWKLFWNHSKSVFYVPMFFIVLTDQKGVFPLEKKHHFMFPSIAKRMIKIGPYTSENFLSL